MGGPGATNTIVIDLVELRGISVDEKTWCATIGAGSLLGDVTNKLLDAGGRALAHGVCPGVGIGGHATVVRLNYQTLSASVLADGTIPGRDRVDVAHVGVMPRPRNRGGGGHSRWEHCAS